MESNQIIIKNKGQKISWKPPASFNKYDEDVLYQAIRTFHYLMIRDCNNATVTYKQLSDAIKNNCDTNPLQTKRCVQILNKAEILSKTLYPINENHVQPA